MAPGLARPLARTVRVRLGAAYRGRRLYVARLNRLRFLVSDYSQLGPP